MTTTESVGSVQLAGQQAASLLLHAALRQALSRFSDALGEAGLPEDPGQFRKTYAAVLPRFEAARLASAQRTEIAACIVDAMRAGIVWAGAEGERPLHEALGDATAPLPLESHAFAGSPGWRAGLVYQGERYDGDALVACGEALAQRGVVTPSAQQALKRVVEQVLMQGELRLQGRKIAVLGGGAEMAPTRFWLEAGADVLWLDTAPPPRDWLATEGMAGRLHWVADNVNLLTQPREVLATLKAFAAGDALDVGLYAYAPGQAREMRLTGVMNALVDALPPELVASVTLLVSPTTPTALDAADRSAMQARLESRPGWEAALGTLGLLGRGGGAEVSGDAAVTRSVVTIQGASYQTAQYLGKVLAAEVWASALNPGKQPLRVSANTAAITRTRSLNHPVFAAAFGGASAFGVETLTPRQSRRLNGLLAVSDWLHDELPEPGSVRVHGGLHRLPYPLDAALRMAAMLGFARSPRLLRGLLAGQPNA